MKAWTTDLEFAYEHGHLYLLDGARHWSDDERIDLRMPADSALFLDSSRVQVLPLSARSFHYKPLASTGDSEVGQVIGEYTLEFKNENAHGLVRGLAI